MQLVFSFIHSIQLVQLVFRLNTPSSKSVNSRYLGDYNFRIQKMKIEYCINHLISLWQNIIANFSNTSRAAFL